MVQSVSAPVSAIAARVARCASASAPGTAAIEEHIWPGARRGVPPPPARDEPQQPRHQVVHRHPAVEAEMAVQQHPRLDRPGQQRPQPVLPGMQHLGHMHGLHSVGVTGAMLSCMFMWQDGHQVTTAPGRVEALDGAAGHALVDAGIGILRVPQR